MQARWFTATILLVAATVACAQKPDFVQGNWEGAFVSGDLKGTPVRAEVVGQKFGYCANLYIGEGTGREVGRFLEGTGGFRRALFRGDVDLGPEAGGAAKLGMTLAKGEINGTFADKRSLGTFTLKRVEKKSPTLGAQPPQGAVVLFDGKNLDAWQETKSPWTITAEGAMEVGKGSLRTKEEYGDGEYHIEFRTPYMPRHKGQGRGNSGVYLLGRYEVQVLDSFGLVTRDNECGGLYKMAVPVVNACLPPAEWQTYDITFRAPKFDPAGNKTQNAFITVKHNGITIHDNVELKSGTAGGISDKEAVKGPLLLQDHGNKVQYRNLWIKPL